MKHNDRFREAFHTLIEQAKDNQKQLVRMVPLQLTASMVGRSPVDTGRFKNNWFAGIGHINSTTTTDTDSSGQGSINRVNTTVGEFVPGQRIYITNSLPYAIPLEHGHSKQAPQGMVMITVNEFVSKVEALAKQIKDRS